MNKPAINIENTSYSVLELPVRPKALLDKTVATIFQIETKYLNRIVSRNKKKFPEDFCFILTDEEIEILKCQNVTSNPRAFNRSNPKAFTWEGCNSIALLLRSDQAAQKSVEIIRAFTTFERLSHSTATDLPQMISSAVVHDRRLIKAVVNEIDFIKTAINSMQNRLDSLEELLHTHTPQIEKVDTTCISPEQAEKLREIVKQKTKNRKQMYKIWRDFKQHFNLNRYTQLQTNEFKNAVLWLNMYKL
ncbi:ORF6N domain-containing protein [Candidatus Uabimicrobium sp. HlEnr_7]|uniref:ORF6N domain-containing protein n=1 Tax=Candidatus Uabimicrobium helgolandensis TaxID=3095367 RepID=UPI003556AE35